MWRRAVEQTFSNPNSWNALASWVPKRTYPKDRLPGYLHNVAISDMPRIAERDNRKAQRYDLRLPLQLVEVCHVETNCQGETRNLSSKGVLFQSNAKFRVGEPVEYLIELLPPRASGVQTQLLCVGRVVRLTRDSEVAVTLDRYEFLRDSI